MKLRLGVARRALFAALFVSPLLLVGLPARRAAAARAQATAPRALVKSIVVGGREQTRADASQAQLTRAGGSVAPDFRTGLALYTGDTIETSAGTRVTVLFLDPPVTERDNEVIINADSKVSISSTYSWWGAIWVKVKGAFDSRTQYVRLGVKGTEYEFRVTEGADRSTVVVLEGTVEVCKGEFTTRPSDRCPDTARAFAPQGAAYVTFASYAPPAAPPQQGVFGRAVDVTAGEVMPIDYNLRITNNCAKAHRFSFPKTGGGAEWLTINEGGDITIAPRRTEPVSAKLTVDARRLSPGAYRGRIYVNCLDCEAEPRCNQPQLEWLINLTVRPKGPADGPQRPFDVNKLQEATLTRGEDRVVRAPNQRVLDALNWTNEVILTSQPTYPARNLLPHFAGVEQRSRSFRSARQSAVLEGDSPGSNRTLGDVYSDWGQGAQAVNVYQKELALGQGRGPADLLADLGEAYRLTGQLSEAQDALKNASASDARSARVRNARGNLSLESVRVEFDKRNDAQAREHLSQADEAYSAVTLVGQAQSAPQQGVPAVQTNTQQGAAVVRTNRGETSLLAGELSLRARDAGEAGRQFEAAAQQFGAAEQSYVFAATDLGVAFRGLGDAAQLERKPDEARANYAKAESQHKQAIARHPDMAEAYFNLGDLYEDTGKLDAAKESYRQAIQARPEQPDAYYPLAVLLQDEDPQAAAELAAVFLELLPKVYRQGERAKNAERISRGEKVPREERIGTTGTTGTTSATVPELFNRTRDEAVSIVLGQGAGTKPVEVPDLRNRDLEAARKRLADRGLIVGRMAEQESCEPVGRVLVQNPPKGTKVERGTAVDITVASAGEQPVTLPSTWVGQSRAFVEAEVRRAGLKLGKVSNEEVERGVSGTVIGHEPAAGAQMARGCEVKLVVALVVERVPVENYVGMPLSDAMALISRAGLRAFNVERASQSPPGYVIAQSEPPGARVRKGTLLILTVSKQVTYVEVPPLIEASIATARSTLKERGLKLEIDPNSPSRDEQASIFEQNPQAGQRVQAGSTVRVKARLIVIR